MLKVYQKVWILLLSLIVLINLYYFSSTNQSYSSSNLSNFLSYPFPKFQANQEKKKFMIYVYELPRKYNELLLDKYKPLTIHNSIFKQFHFEKHFYQTLLNDSIRTRDPKEADLFYVPFFVGLIQILKQEGLGDGLDLDEGKMVKEVEMYLSTFQEGIYWRRNEGRDHIFTNMNAWCGSFSQSDPNKNAFPNSILIQNDIFFEYQNYKNHLSFSNHIIVPYMNVPDSYLSKRIWLQTQQPFSSFNQTGNGIRKSYLMSFIGSLSALSNGKTIRTYLQNQMENYSKQHQQEYLFESFEEAEKYQWQVDYKKNVLFLNFKKRTFEGYELMAEIYAKSVFCPIPRGDTSQTKRLFDAIFSLCIPVIISDKLLLPYAAYIPYSEFVIFYPYNNFQNADFIKFLLSLSNDEILKRQKLMLQYRSYLAFPPSLDADMKEGDLKAGGGGSRDAWELLLEELEVQSKWLNRWKGYEERIRQLESGQIIMY